MFIPNTKALVYSHRGYNLYGEPDFNEPVEVPCAVVKLDVISEKTSVRTDSSASRGNANETIAKSRILFASGYAVDIGDKIEISGVLLIIVSVFARLDVSGKVDHYDCSLEKWTQS